MTPTQRSLKHLRDQGYLAQVVEKWIPQARRRQDLYGFIDILAIRDNEVLGVQATSRSNVSSRVRKIAESPHIDAVRDAGIRIEVHGWGKMASGRYEVRVEDVS